MTCMYAWELPHIATPVLQQVKLQLIMETRPVGTRMSAAAAAAVAAAARPVFANLIIVPVGFVSTHLQTKVRATEQTQTSGAQSAQLTSSSIITIVIIIISSSVFDPSAHISSTKPPPCTSTQAQQDADRA